MTHRATGHHTIVRWLSLTLLLFVMFPSPASAQGTPIVPSTETDWPMYRGNPERTGDMPGPGIDGEPVQLWRTEVDGQINSAPAVVNGTVYFGAGNGGVYALDTETGDELWQFNTGNPISSAPAVADGVVYVGSNDGTLYALDAATGTEQWTFPGIRPNASVAIVDGIVYSGSEDGYLYAIDAATGDEQWRAELGDAASRSAAVADGVVYVGSADGVLHSFDAATGEPGWTFQTEGGGILATPTISNGMVFQATFDAAESFVYAIDTVTGEQIWRFEQAGNPGFLAGGTNGDLFFSPSLDTHVYALDTATGAEAWRFKTGEIANAAPAIIADTLYFAGNDGFLYAIQADSGEETWRFAVEGAADYGPAVVDGVAYVGTNFGYMYAIGGTGEVAATPDATAPVSATPDAPPSSPVATPAASTGLADFIWQVGPENGLSGQPFDVTIAPDGTIWTWGELLHLIDPNGSVIETWDGPDPSTRSAFAEGAIHFDRDGNLYIVDTPNHRILKTGPDREILLTWGSQGQGDGQFQKASDLVIDSEGNIYIVDVILQRIQKFGPDGTFLATISGPGEGEGQLNATARMGIDQDDNLYVPDGSQVEVFASDGTFLRSFGAGNLGYAVDAAVDANGIIYVSDAQQNQIQVYDPAGNLLGSWGAFGREPGNFNGADAVTLDGLGNLYVVDFENRRIQKFEVTLPVMPGATPVN